MSDQPTPVGLAGFAVGGMPPTVEPFDDPAPPPAPELVPYTAEEVATIVATVTALGVPAEAITTYHRTVIEQSRPGLELLGVGPALAEYGIGKGGAGLEAMPAWARLLAGAALAGWVVVSARRASMPTETEREPGVPTGDDFGGAV